jgi:glutamyl-tRNA synthetase
MKDRASTVVELSNVSSFIFRGFDPSEQMKAKYYTSDIRPALLDLKIRLSELPNSEWKRERISDILKAVIGRHNLKLPQIAMPLRVIISAGTQTPSIDATLELIGRDEVLARMEKQLQAFPE